MPLRERMHYANYRRERYANDPLFRLRIVNANRRLLGLPEFTDPSEVPTLAQAAKTRAATRRRNDDGTFV